jgi:hypothetical protein
MLDRPRARAAKPSPQNWGAARQRERTRRYRQRQGNGIAVALVPYTAAVIDMLCRLRWLAEADAGDRRKIEAALSAMIDDAARR